MIAPHSEPLKDEPQDQLGRSRVAVEYLVPFGEASLARNQVVAHSSVISRQVNGADQSRSILRVVENIVEVAAEFYDLALPN